MYVKYLYDTKPQMLIYSISTITVMYVTYLYDTKPQSFTYVSLYLHVALYF
jgi:hypothetical protein